MPKLAIAHVAADEFIARKIHTMLAESGYDVWFDPMAEHWDSSRWLEHGSGADAVILLLSDQWAETEWPDFEAGSLEYEADLVIPVLLSASYSQHLSSSSAWLDDAIVVVHERPDFLDRFVDQLRARLSLRLPDHRVHLFSDMMVDEEVACLPPEMATWDGMRHYFDEVVRSYRHLDSAVGVFDYIQTQHATTNAARPGFEGRPEELSDRAKEAVPPELPGVRRIQHHLYAGLSLLSVGASERRRYSGSATGTPPPSGCAVKANVAEQWLPRFAGLFEASFHREIYRYASGSWASSHCRHLGDNCFEFVSARPEVVIHSNMVRSDEASDVLAVSHLDVDQSFALTRARLTELQETLEILVSRLLSPPDLPTMNTVDALCIHQRNLTRTLLVAPCLDYVLGTTFIQDYDEESVCRALTPSGLWSEDRVSELRTLWSEGNSASQIACLLGVGFTRNRVIGKVHRLGLAARAVKCVRPIWGSTICTEADAGIGPCQNSLVPEVAVDPEDRTDFDTSDAFRFALASWPRGALSADLHQERRYLCRSQ